MLVLNKTLIVIIIITAVSAGGCSTMLAHHGKYHHGYSLFTDPRDLCFHDEKDDRFSKYYSGVSMDLYMMFKAPFSDHGEFDGLFKIYYPITLTYSVVDLSFSLTADTLLFPYEYYVSSNCWAYREGIRYFRWGEGTKYVICGRDAIQKIRDDSERLNEQKAHTQAKAKLEEIISTCSERIDRTTVGWIRNDLARTLYKLGDYSGCLDVLQPLKEEASMADEKFRSKYVSIYGPQFGPGVAETALAIAKTTRANLKLCSHAP